MSDVLLNYRLVLFYIFFELFIPLFSKNEEHLFESHQGHGTATRAMGQFNKVIHDMIHDGMDWEFISCTCR